MGAQSSVTECKALGLRIWNRRAPGRLSRLVKHRALDFRSGRDLTVLEIRARPWLCADSVQPLEILSPSVCPPLPARVPTHTLSL